jgi:phage terminase Nu1 subunit (DNA packaging protein)
MIKTLGTELIAGQVGLLREGDVARILGLTPRALQVWRARGRGPVFRKMGSAVRYSLDDVRMFIAQSARGGGQAAGEAGREASR